MPGCNEYGRQEFIRWFTVDMVPRKDFVFKVASNGALKHYGIVSGCLARHLREVPAKSFAKRFVPALVQDVDVIIPFGLKWEFA